MRQLRTFYCAFSFVASLVALAHHLGFNLWGCASCSLVNELPMSSGLAWLGPIALGGLTFVSYREIKWSRELIVVASLISIGLVYWMFHYNSVCEICLLIHIGVLGAALTLVPKVSYSSPILFSLAVVFSASGGLGKLVTEQGVALFQPREGETIPVGKVFVLFSDPQCGRCQLVEGEIAKLVPKPNILYRWTLLPQKTYGSIRAVALLELARKSGNLERLLAEFQNLVPPLTDDALVGAAKKAGLGTESVSWLKNPPEKMQNDIAEDGAISRTLKIESLPALAELYPPDATGQRLLRRVPFSAIGISP